MKTAVFILLSLVLPFFAQSKPHHPGDSNQVATASSPITAPTNTPAAFHQWTFKAGGKFEGKPILFKETVQAAATCLQLQAPHLLRG